MKITPMTPDDPLPDLEKRLAALHELGPMEFDPVEPTAIANALAQLDNASRAAMNILAGGPP